MPFSVVAPTAFLQAANNPILVTATKSDYAIGQFFYCEVWVTPNKDMRSGSNSLSGATQLISFQKAGEANGSCTFDISSVLASQFTASNYTVPDPQQRFQKDESSYVQWFVKVGWLYYNAQNVAVKTEEFISGGDNFAVRAALDTAGEGDMSQYCNVYDDQGERLATFATHIPQSAKRGPSEPTLLSFFTPIIASATNRTLRLEADLNFSDGSGEGGYVVGDFPLDSGGLYLVNVKPGIISGHLRYEEIVSYTVRVAYFDDQATTPLIFTDDHAFQIKKDVPNPKTVLFINTLGSWDALHFRKDFDASSKAKTSLFKNTRGSKTYAVDGVKTITYQSSWLGIEEYQWLEDLRYSPAIYVDGQYVRQVDGDYKSDTSVGLFTYELVVNPDVNKNAVRF